MQHLRNTGKLSSFFFYVHTIGSAEPPFSVLADAMPPSIGGHFIRTTSSEQCTVESQHIG